jgi:hypothetical protein
MNNILHAKALASIFGATDEIKQEVNIGFFYHFNPYSNLIEVDSVSISEQLDFVPSDLKQDLTVSVADILGEKEQVIVMCEKNAIQFSVKHIIPLDMSYSTNMLFI